jgi:hypothetical protein
VCCATSSREAPRLDIQLCQVRISVDEKRCTGMGGRLVVQLRRGGLEEDHRSTADLGRVSSPVLI